MPLIPVRSINAIMAHVTYAVPFLWVFTGKNGTVQRNRAFTRESVLRRLATDASRKDLFYYLVRQHIDSDSFIPLKAIIEWRGTS